MKPEHPSFGYMRLAVEALIAGSGPVHTRLQAAEPHFAQIERSELRTRAERHLDLRIGAGLVEGGEEDDALSVADSIALLDDSRAVEIAGDMFRLFELMAGLRSDDGYGLSD